MFSVNIEQLRQTSRDLEAVSSTVRHNARRGLAEDLAGNGVVTERMRSVERDWSRSRGTICDFLSALAFGAGAAADLYAAVEDELIRSMAVTSTQSVSYSSTALPGDGIRRRAEQ